MRDFNIPTQQEQPKKKPVEDEGAKEFADLFSIADSKIKDRS